jgi:hypothetical protein
VHPFAGAAGGAGGIAGAAGGVAPEAAPPAGEDGNGKRTLASVLAALERRKFRSEAGDDVVTLNDVAYLVTPLGNGGKRRQWGTIIGHTVTVPGKQGKPGKKGSHQRVCEFLGGYAKGFRYAQPRRERSCNGGLRAKCLTYQKVVDRLREMDEARLRLKWNGPG